MLCSNCGERKSPLLNCYIFAWCGVVSATQAPDLVAMSVGQMQGVFCVILQPCYLAFFTTHTHVCTHTYTDKRTLLSVLVSPSWLRHNNFVCQTAANFVCLLSVAKMEGKKQTKKTSVVEKQTEMRGVGGGVLGGGTTEKTMRPMIDSHSYTSHFFI